MAEQQQNVISSARWRALGLAGLTAVLTAACANGVHEEDWVAARAAEISKENPGFPRLRDIPAMPEDLRAAEDWEAAIRELELVREELEILAEQKRAATEE